MEWSIHENIILNQWHLMMIHSLILYVLLFLCPVCEALMSCLMASGVMERFRVVHTWQMIWSCVTHKEDERSGDIPANWSPLNTIRCDVLYLCSWKGPSVEASLWLTTDLVETWRRPDDVSPQTQHAGVQMRYRWTAIVHVYRKIMYLD